MTRGRILKYAGGAVIALIMPTRRPEYTRIVGYLTTAATGGLALLQRMARRWPFFDDLLSKIEMVCAKADMEIARLYVETLGGDVRLFERLKAEFDATVSAILRIRESDVLMRDTPVIRSAMLNASF